MSNSKLVSYIKISPNKTSGRNHSIDTITIHCMAGNLSIEQCGDVFAPTSRSASSNYGIGSDGRIGLYVDESDRSWCTSSSANDNRAVTIEVANDGGESTGWHVSDLAMSSLIKLCADICHRNNIPKLMWHADKSLVGQVSIQNMTVHRWFSNKSCPGDYLYNKHSYIAQEVNKLLSVPYNESDYTIKDYKAPDPMGSSSYIDPKSLIHTEAIHPFIATLDPSLSHVDCDKLRSAKVIGVMVYGGSYFNALHMVKKYYRSDNLRKQITSIESGGLPYAMYVDVRARTIEEAKKECNSLWYVVSKFPPSLGLWLRIDTGCRVGVNNQILETYYKYIVKWGLKDSCGIYSTRSALQNITWEKFYNRFLLWLVDHVSNVDEVSNKLLDPEFFIL